MTDLTQLVRTIQSLPPDKAETVLRNHMQQEWRNGYSVGTKTTAAFPTEIILNMDFESVDDLQGQAAARGANNLPTGYDNDY